MDEDDFTQSTTPSEPKDPLSLHILGVCTGVGLEKLEFVQTQYTQAAPASKLCARLIRHEQLPIPSHTRSSILDSFHEAERSLYARLHVNDQLGRLFVEGIREFCSKHNVKCTSIDLVATHFPNLPETAHLDAGSEYQTHSWSSAISTGLGITAVNHFTISRRAHSRARPSPDAFVDRLYLQHPTKFRACLNIADLAYLIFIPPHTGIATLPCISRELGPGNILVSYATRYCTSNTHIDDNDGRLASAGRIHDTIVDQFSETYDDHPFTPTPSMVREMFGAHEAQALIDDCIYLGLSEADIMATVTRITAKNLVKQYNILLRGTYPAEQVVDELFLCGPGARNPRIVDYIQEQLSDSVTVRSIEDVGIPGDTHDAFCYAHLALEIALREATKPEGDEQSLSSDNTQTQVVQGHVTPGTRWDGLVDSIRSFSGGQKLPLTSEVVVMRGLEEVANELFL